MRCVTFSPEISAEIMNAYRLFNSNNMLTIYASAELDEFTFKHLRAIAAGFDVQLHRATFPIKDFEETARDPLDKLKSLRVIDELQTVKKSIERLKIFSQTL